MDALPKKNPKQILIILGILVLIEILGSVIGIINLYYYDYRTQSFTGIFRSNLSRFLVREILVYLNAAIGFFTIKKIIGNGQLAGLFLIVTFILDILFIASGFLRQFGYDNLSILTAYSNIYNIIGSGMLFLFFAIIAISHKNKQVSLYN